MEELNKAFNKGYQKGVNDTKGMKMFYLQLFVLCILGAGLMFKFVVVPLSNQFLFDKVQYVPYCPEDPPEGLELMGEAELL